MYQRKTSCADFIGANTTFGESIKNLVDKWDLFYNSGDSLQGVASGQGDEVSLANEVIFELFLDDVNNGGA